LLNVVVSWPRRSEPRAAVATTAIPLLADPFAYSGSGAFVLELHAPAGSVVCFDTGNIHHGKRLAGGTRHAATIYFSSPAPRSEGSRAPVPALPSL